MKTYIVKRTGQMLLILIFVSVFTFMLMSFIPSDPVYAMLGEGASREEYDRVHHELKLDQPVIRRYFGWLGGAVQGDQGQPTQFHKSTLEVLNERIPIIMFFSFSAFIISIPLGILFGVTSAVCRGRPADTVVTLIASITACLPQSWIALLVMYTSAMKFGWLPSYGFTWFSQNLFMGIYQTIMPLLCLALGGIIATTKQMRSSMLEAIHQDYVRIAKGKGFSSREVIYIHALKNALIPVITVLGVRLGSMLTGSMSMESVFNIPGMGSLLVKTIQSCDTPVVQACVLIAALVSYTINLFMDILYTAVDPRVRYE